MLKQNQFSQRCQRVREISFFEKIFIIIFSEDVWKTVAKPNVVNTAEGEDVTVEVQIAGGNPEKLPEVKFVKGKWNELNGPNYVIDANTEASFQISRTFSNSPIQLRKKNKYRVRFPDGHLVRIPDEAIKR